jgi:hypothetical protein
MNLISTAISFAALTLSASSLAKTPDINSTITVKANSSIVRTYIAPDEFREIGGRYNLENGKTMLITQKQNRYYAEISGMEKTEVIPTSTAIFVSADQNIKLKFDSSNSAFSTTAQVTYTEVAQ